MFLAHVGGKMGCDVPTSAGPSQHEDLCISPASKLPTPSSQEAQIQDYEGRGSPLAYL